MVWVKHGEGLAAHCIGQLLFPDHFVEVLIPDILCYFLVTVRIINQLYLGQLVLDLGDVQGLYVQQVT